MNAQLQHPTRLQISSTYFKQWMDAIWEIIYCRVTYTSELDGLTHLAQGWMRDFSHTECAIRGRLLPPIGSATAVTMHLRDGAAGRVLTRLQAPIDVGEPVTVGASIGIAFNSNMNETGEELIRDADQAMYRAKAQGKNRYVISDHKVDVPTPELLGRWKRMMQLKWY